MNLLIFRFSNNFRNTLKFTNKSLKSQFNLKICLYFKIKV